jgi:hypothetical protein
MERSRRQIIKENPSLEEAHDTIKSGISRKKTVIVVGSCTVNYEGRASSELGLGERICIFKPDGSAQIHRPRDSVPVNWQPPGSLFRTRHDDDGLLMRIFRRKANEVLEVRFKEIMMLAALDLVDVAAFNLYASEEDMKKAILLQPNLLEEGFRPIASEKPVEPGFIDILGRDSRNVLTVVEIKRKAADRDAVLQLRRYVNAFQTDAKMEMRGIIVAPEMKKGAQKTLASLGLEFKVVSPQTCADVLRRRKGKPLTEFLT